MTAPAVERLAAARIPTPEGEFRLCYYGNTLDDREHLALLFGNVEGRAEVLVRVHSECFTGDVMGSLRCDCGEQLTQAMRVIAQEGHGVILYLRQEGRNIGLLNKLRAYNLQDDGYDTVDANLRLGHGADERDYTIAALMLKDLGIPSIRLITNNPVKIQSMQRLGIRVVERVPSHPRLTAENARYMQTKVRRMRHLLNLGPLTTEEASPGLASAPFADQRAAGPYAATKRPFVTLSYAQSLDGSIAAVPGCPLRLSGAESLVMTHRLRSSHEAILVGIGTVLADDPRLTVRHVDGPDPRPVVLDTMLRLPLEARLLARAGAPPLIATSDRADPRKRRALEEAGATVVSLPQEGEGLVDLEALLTHLGARGIRSVMVEGGTQVITNFIARRLVDHVIITIAATLVGGVPALRALHPGGGDGQAAPPPATAFPRLHHLQVRWLGEDLVLQGDPVWSD